jgi:hypothetical protein
MVVSLHFAFCVAFAAANGLRWRQRLSGNGHLRVPAALQALPYQVALGNTESLGSLGQCHRLSEHRDVTVGSGIGRLLPLRRPIAIIGGVRAVVVATLQRLVRRTRSHVSVEVLEAIAPPLTDRDAAPTVAVVVRPLGLMAATPHVRPNPVLGRLRHSVSRDGFFSSRSEGDHPRTPASGGFARSEVEPRHKTHRSAIATAQAARPAPLQNFPRSIALMFHYDDMTWKNDDVNWKAA